MGGVRVGVEVADRDRLDPGRPDALRRRPHPGLVEGAEHLAARPGSLPDLEAELARHKRRRALVKRLVELRHPHPPELEHVAEAAGGEERGRGALAFEDRVGRDGAPVQQLLERPRRRSELLEEAPHPRDHRVRVVRRGGRELAGREPPVRSEHGHVGEGAPDVGGGAGHGTCDSDMVFQLKR